MPKKRETPCLTCGGSSRHGQCMACYRATLPTLEQRFWSHVDASGGLDACWPWTGARNRTGYGVIGHKGRGHTASRTSLEIALGRPLGPGLEACHRCDNPPCVNPSHLFEGTHRENGQDMTAKGRNATARHPESVARGERDGMAKLTTEVVRRIRAEARTTPMPELAREFGVSLSHAHRLVKGESWAHVPMEATNA